MNPTRCFSPCLAFLALAAANVNAKPDGGYTSAQSARGGTVYRQYCAECHGSNLQGESGPELMGQTFRSSYGGGTVRCRRMPRQV